MSTPDWEVVRQGERYMDERYVDSVWELAVDHGIKDAKGRAIQGHASIQHITRTGATRADVGWSLEPMGELDLYLVYVRVLRDGKPYGASHRARKFATLQQAMEAATKGLSAQAKRYGDLART
jgi:hypothetical protein